MEEHTASYPDAMSLEHQEKMTAMQAFEDPDDHTQNTQILKHESQSPQPANKIPSNNEAMCFSGMKDGPRTPESVSFSKTDEEPRNCEAAGSSMTDGGPRKHESRVPGMAAVSDKLSTESSIHEAQKSPDASLSPKQAPGNDDDQNVPAINEITEDKKQLQEQKSTAKKSSKGIGYIYEAECKAIRALIDEEQEIEQRAGMPSEKPGDKTRLLVVKQEIQRLGEAMGQNQVLEGVDIAGEMEIAQNSMGVPVQALRANHSKKPVSTAKRTATSVAKKRKDPASKVGLSTKKRKVIPEPMKASKPAPKPAPKQSLNPALKRQLKDADAIGKYTFDQLAGKGSVTSEMNALKKNLPSLRGLTQVQRAALVKMRAAAENIETPDAATKERIDNDIRAVITMMRPFGNSCKLKLLRGEEDGGEKKYLEDYAWEIEGMASAPRHHQMIAAGYMCIMEQAKKCSGGLLFDYMGYGKTVETLALITVNPGSQDAKASGGATTLVVVPSAAAQQWHDEVHLHCPSLVASLWTNPTNIRSLLASDVLIITYPQLRNAFKEAAGIQKQERKPKKGKEDNEEYQKPVLTHPLFKATFHRIILDEMHEIKGYRNLTFDAVMALEAEYKWGLTGTPTPNGIEEVFPYLKFIDHPDVTTMREFKKKYVGGQRRNVIPDEQRFERLRELLAPVMIMRTPSHSFLGTTLLRLPKGHALPPIIVKIPAEEDIIYRSIEYHIKDHIMNKAAQKGTKVGCAALQESLTRLRQCLVSPLLLRPLAKEGFWSAGDVATMKKGAQDAGCKTTPFIDQIERWNLKSNLGRASTTPGFVMPETTLMDAKAALDATTCPGRGCMKPIPQLTEPQMSECGHVWCKLCLEKEIKIEQLINEKEIPECSRCGKPLGQAKPFSPAESGQQIARPVDQHLNSQKRPGEDYNGKLPRGSNLMDFLNQDPGMKMPRSSKVDAVIRQVVAWQTEDPEGKIIIFIQWVDLNGILGRVLQEEDIEFLYYPGTAEMKEQDRKTAIDTFKQDPYVKVLICSLRCGGQALNLTCANRTIMVDLWWNYSVEAQATARVYRMGQQKETYSVRVIVQDSVDEKIYRLQESKLQVIQSAFQEFEADKNLDKETLFKLLGWQSDILDDEDNDYEDCEDDDFIDDDDADDADGEYKPWSRRSGAQAWTISHDGGSPSEILSRTGTPSLMAFYARSL